MKKALTYGVALSLLMGGAMVQARNQGSVATRNENQPRKLREADLLAAKALIQLEYLRLSRQAEIDGLALGDIREQGSVAFSVFGAGTFVAAAAANLAGSVLLAHSFSFKEPGVYAGTTSNPSSILGGPGTRQYKYVVTWQQAYGPFLIGGAVSSFAVGSLYVLDSKLSKQAASTAAGRALIGFDKRLTGIVLESVEDLSNLLDLSAERKQRLADVMIEDVVAQISAGKTELTVDTLAVATKAGLVDKESLDALKSVAFLGAASDLSQDMAAVLQDESDPRAVQARLDALVAVRSVLAKVNGTNSKASQQLAAMMARTNLAIAYLQSLR